MPTIYLSPSTQESNLYVNGGSEEYYMNLLADDMVPWLRASGIQIARNTPQMTAASSIRASNAGNYDLHVALHSNAAGEGKYGTARGSIIFYAPGSVNGKRAAEIVAANLRSIYPLPDKVRTEATLRLGEVRQTRAPSVFIELAYHDNEQDAQWIKDNLPEIAKNIAGSIAEYFGLPLVTPQSDRTGRVVTQSGGLNIRSRPSMNGSILTSAPNGTVLTVLGERNGWSTVNYNGVVGFARSGYIAL